jgi:hypothetical protein
MDEQTKQALQELKETADRFAATVARAIERDDATLAEIEELGRQFKDGARKGFYALCEATAAAEMADFTATLPGASNG